MTQARSPSGRAPDRMFRANQYATVGGLPQSGRGRLSRLPRLVPATLGFPV